MLTEKLPSEEGVICSIVTTPYAPDTIIVTGVPLLRSPTWPFYTYLLVLFSSKFFTIFYVI